MEEKNPFSLFDFLGYFFPGAFALLIIWSSYIVWTKEDILPISYLYDSICYYSNGKLINKRILGISTIPHRSRTMEQALRYMTPNVYEENLFQENILSPFHRSNRMYYKYSVTPLPFGMAQVYAYPLTKF